MEQEEKHNSFFIKLGSTTCKDITFCNAKCATPCYRNIISQNRNVLYMSISDLTQHCRDFTPTKKPNRLKT